MVLAVRVKIAPVFFTSFILKLFIHLPIYELRAMIAIKEAFRAGLVTRKNLVRNILAGVIVGIVALPMSMAFAIASGARPEDGLYTAIVAGFLVAVFGGTRSQIAGPTGAFIVILAGVTAKYGFAGLQIASLMAGVMLLCMGFLRLGTVIKFIPEPVIAGFTSGIGVIIFVGEWKDFFGLHAELALDAKFHQKLYVLSNALLHLNVATSGIAILSLILVVFSHKIIKKIPGPLIAMVVATLLLVVCRYFNLPGFKDVATLGSVFGSIPRGLPPVTIPHLNFSAIMTLVGPAFTIALLGAIESLLSATAADGLAGTRHNPNQELVGQGIANIFTPLLGGFAATGAIARTATNIRNGGNNFIAALVHSLLLLVIVVLLAPLAEYIPLCSLAAILFVVSYNMSDIPHVGYILRHAPRDDRIILVVTFLLTVFTNLVTAVEIGVILAMLFFMRKMTATSQVSESLATELVDESGGEVNFGADLLVYTVNGPLFFGVAEKFVETLSATHTKANAVIFKLQTVPFVDTSGLSSFQEAIEKLHKHRVRVYLYGVNPLIEQKFAEIGLLKLVAGQKSFNSLRDIAKEEAKS